VFSCKSTIQASARLYRQHVIFIYNIRGDIHLKEIDTNRKNYYQSYAMKANLKRAFQKYFLRVSKVRTTDNVLLADFKLAVLNNKCIKISLDTGQYALNKFRKKIGQLNYKVYYCFLISCFEH